MVSPVLVGFVGDVPFNPVRMLMVQASGLVNKSRSHDDLRKLYDVWSARVIQ
jgi:hypothetical protein